ncbi:MULTISPECIES: hypothetical protein [unclassified Methylobacterium]|jgi:hypothetical protein|uniref:hypothetical protein n=1 Tax=unclassified Methylobacterium TaxID=2615210 RepID=UPI00135265D0|nr:hypothetical protein [Methylobacterium sp. 2A]MWV23938.1 hypothetical protein [Methylobacterium sp. 2A]
MTMEAYALCTRPMSSVTEWQSAINALGFDLTLQVEQIPPVTRGHLPATWQGRQAGFECSVIPLSDLTETYPDINFGGPWACIYAFYFATISSCAGVWIAVAACVRQLGGIAFDPQEGHLLAGEDAIRYAHETLASATMLEAQLSGPPAG